MKKYDELTMLFEGKIENVDGANWGKTTEERIKEKKEGVKKVIKTKRKLSEIKIVPAW